MKAAVLRQYGGPESLSYEEVNDPVLGKEEVLVRIKACALNRIDVWFRSGRYKTSLPRILGTDISGVVESVGEDVRNISAGERVVVYNVVSDGTCHYCANGKRNRCMNVGFIGGVCDGGYAELISVNSYNVIKANIDYDVACCLPVDFSTSLNAIKSIGGLGPEDTVLVIGASGGLGHAFVQLSKSFGATVIAATSSYEKFEFLKSIGADHVLNYRDENFETKVLEITNGLGVSVALDHVGSSTWSKNLGLLCKGGKMIAAGITSGENASINIASLYRKEQRIYGVYAAEKHDLYNAVRLASLSKISPAIFRKFKLSEIVEAHKLLDSGNFYGKIVINP